MKRLLSAILMGLLFQTAIDAQLTQQPEWNKPLTAEEKIYILSKVWKEASENFAFFDKVPALNWDSLYRAYIPLMLKSETRYESYRLLEKFICSLKDGHTFMYHFNELFPHYKRLGFNNGTLKLLPSHINKRVFITRVGNKAMADSIPVGTEILEVNNMPVKQYLEQYVFPYIPASTEHVLWDNGVGEMFRGVIDVPDSPSWLVKFKKPNGVIFTKGLTLSSDTLDNSWYPAYPEWKWVDFKWITEKEIAYVAVNSFGKDTIIQIFQTLLPQLKNAKGIILDLRLNGGGSTNIAAAILQYFTNADTLIGSKWKTRTGNAYYKATGRLVKNKNNLSNAEEKMYVDYYRNNSWMEGPPMKFSNKSRPEERLHTPLVVLTGNNTASAAEDFLIMLDGLKGRAITIGQVTNGSTGQPLFLPIVTGGSFQICTKRDMYPDGREFVGIGIIPAIEINPSPEDIFKNSDIILKRAIEEINKKIK